MRSIRFSLILVLIVILVSGCMPNFPQRVPTGGPVMEPTEQVTEGSDLPTAVKGLSLEQIMNAEYLLSNGSTRVQLVDGDFERISDNETLLVSILDNVVFGDLDGDEAEDAAVILVENYGGTGLFKYLVSVFNFEGDPFPIQGYFLGDRVQVNSMVFDGSLLVLDMLVHGPNDGLCCPTHPKVSSFEYYPGLGLKLVHVTSGGGQGFRDIVLDGPIRGEHISNNFQVSGSFTISPFEATLVVRVVDMQDQILFEGPIMAPVDNLGDPGTFNDIVDMTSVNPSPGLVRIEIFEVSMADGSILVLDSVLVILD